MFGDGIRRGTESISTQSRVGYHLKVLLIWQEDAVRAASSA